MLDILPSVKHVAPMDCNRVTLERHSQLVYGVEVKHEVTMLRLARLKSPDGLRWVLVEERMIPLPEGKRISPSDQQKAA